MSAAPAPSGGGVYESIEEGVGEYVPLGALDSFDWHFDKFGDVAMDLKAKQNPQLVHHSPVFTDTKRNAWVAWFKFHEFDSGDIDHPMFDFGLKLLAIGGGKGGNVLKNVKTVEMYIIEFANNDTPSTLLPTIVVKQLAIGESITTTGPRTFANWNPQNDPKRDERLRKNAKIRFQIKFRGTNAKVVKYCDLTELSIENAASTLTFAHRRKIDWMRTKIIDFILANNQAVAQTDGWKKLKRDFPGLCHMVTEAFFKYTI